MSLYDYSAECTYLVRRHHHDRLPNAFFAIFISLFCFGFSVPALIDPAPIIFIIYLSAGIIMFTFGVSFITSAVRWYCPGCKRPLHAKEPWRCELCKIENRKNSYFDCCENPKCEAVPTQYECQYCHTVSQLFRAPKGNVTARSLNAPITSLEPTPFETMRAEKSQQIETTEWDRRLCEAKAQQSEAEAKKLVAEIRVEQLQKQRSTSEPVILTPHQARIKWAAEQFTEADFLCTTVPQTVEKELECHAKIDANPNIQDDAIKQQLKRAMSIHFESMRRGLNAPDVQVEKDHR